MKSIFRVALLAALFASAELAHAGSVPLPDGKYGGHIDGRGLYAPARKTNGTLFIVPKRDDFDSVRVDIAVARKGVRLGDVRGAIVYWRGDQCVIGFQSIQLPEGTDVTAHGYVPVAQLTPVTPRPGAEIFIPASERRSVDVFIDHTSSPPTDAADDDGD
ncbi:hypothetical protein [Burkholderia pseudomallei]|uniref:hypothetical protein n=1 Tax=Burkholderia pseudomallei TaxID=28450 RepID=UPI0012F48D1A|nr:hypothetical protein [Burkholderia pseudomallei]